MKNKISKRIQKAIKEKVFPGCVVGVVRRGGQRTILPFGSFTYQRGSCPIKSDSIFDIASITKVIPTSCLAIKLINDRKLGINNRVVDYIPELHNSFREKILIKHLLTQTLDYGNFRLSAYRDRESDEILKAVFNAELANSPGKYYFSTNSASILLGIVIERAMGRRMDELSRNIFFKSLKMMRTTFDPKRFDKSEIVPSEICKWRNREIRGEVHDESAFSLSEKRVVGSAGLFSTAPDLLNFVEMLLNRGTYKNKRYFSKKIVALMHTNQLKQIHKNTGLGWELFQRRFMGKRAGFRTFGKTGFTGCSVVCDIGRGVGIVILSNHIHPKRRQSSKVINEVRRDIADMVFKSL